MKLRKRCNEKYGSFYCEKSISVYAAVNVRRISHVAMNYHLTLIANGAINVQQRPRRRVLTKQVDAHQSRRRKASDSEELLRSRDRPARMDEDGAMAVGRMT